MGLFDRIELPADISLPGLDTDPSTVECQTKSIDRPMMRRFQLTGDGRLLQEETHSEEVPEEERPYYGTDEWEERPFVGSIRTVHDGWTERRYHGVVEFHAALEDRFARYEAKFTEGRLTAVRDISENAEDDWVPAEDVLPDQGDRLTEIKAAQLDTLLDAVAVELDSIEENEQVRSTRDAIDCLRSYIDRRNRGQR